MLAAESVSGIPSVIEMSPWTTTIDWQESYLTAFEKGWILVELPAPLASNKPGKVTFSKITAKKDAVTCSPTLPHIHAMKNQAQNLLTIYGRNICVRFTEQERFADRKRIYRSAAKKA